MVQVTERKGIGCTPSEYIVRIAIFTHLYLHDVPSERPKFTLELLSMLGKPHIKFDEELFSHSHDMSQLGI